MYIEYCQMNLITFSFFLFVQDLLAEDSLVNAFNRDEKKSSTQLGCCPLPSPYSPAYSTFLLNKCSLVAVVPSIGKPVGVRIDRKPLKYNPS